MLYPDSRLIFFDLEGTGTDPYRDRIVEFCLLRTDGEAIVTRVNPGIPIPPEATAVHGISDADVASAPTFRELAAGIQAVIAGAAFCGYNIRRYDTILLDSELRRAGEAGLHRDNVGNIAVPEVDLYRLWAEKEPRTLAGAARRFAGVELGGDAHSAEADTRVLPAVLTGMIAQLALEEDVSALARLSVPAGEVDRDGKFLRREDGVVVFNFTDSRGRPAKDDPGLLRWMLGKGFAADTKAVCFDILDQIDRERQEELRRQREAREKLEPTAASMARGNAGLADDDDDLPF